MNWPPACHGPNLMHALIPELMLQGLPVRIEVGPKDVAQNACVTARRDRPGKAGKTFGVPMDPPAFVEAVQKLLAEASLILLGRLVDSLIQRGTGWAGACTASLRPAGAACLCLCEPWQQSATCAGAQPSAKALQGTVASCHCPHACCLMLLSPAQGLHTCSADGSAHGMQALLWLCTKGLAAHC